MPEHPLQKYNVVSVTDLDALIEDQDFYDYCYNYYLPQMPYGTAKARTGDPGEWIFAQLERDFLNHEQ